jgi:hypothetical protein
MGNALGYVWVLVTLLSFPIGLGFFILAWYHGWKMFMNRSGHWAGYYIPLGFLIDAALDEEGICHRAKTLKCLMIAALFMIVLALNALLRIH